MEEGSDQQALKRIEAALARIDRASERLVGQSVSANSAKDRPDAGLRKTVEKALSDLDALIEELER